MGFELGGVVSLLNFRVFLSSLGSSSCSKKVIGSGVEEIMSILKEDAQNQDFQLRRKTKHTQKLFLVISQSWCLPFPSFLDEPVMSNSRFC